MLAVSGNCCRIRQKKLRRADNGQTKERPRRRTQRSPSRQVKPGDLVIIPKGTPHGSTKPDGRPFKTIALKTPPQARDDTKLLD